MRINFLGTGAAGGVPLFGCTCVACERARLDPVFVRRPCSALIESGNTRILLDAGLTDLHERFNPGELDAIVLTHFHPDHVQGLFHLRWGVVIKARDCTSSQSLIKTFSIEVCNEENSYDVCGLFR